MKTEELALWYFRLNGFFTITNFVLHPSRRGPQRTDADIIGVRFPHRSEFPDAPGGDESEFARQDKSYFVIAEVKRSVCQLNGPWTDSNRENIQAVLRDLGAFPPDDIERVAESLYKNGVFNGAKLYCSLFCMGDEKNPDIATSYPQMPQRTWKEILGFIFDRFQTYHVRKADHDSWDEIGKGLWSAWSGTTRPEFIAKVRQEIGLTTTA